MHPQTWRLGLTSVLAAWAAVVLVVISELSYQRATDSLDGLGARGMARTAIQTLMRRLLDAETAQRGYLLTGRVEYLAPYNAVAADLAKALTLLREHYRSDSGLARVTEDLAARSLEKMSEASETIRLYDAGAHNQWHDLVLTDIGREKMEAVRKAAELLLAAEDERVVKERASVYRTLQLGRLGGHTMTLISVLALIFFLRKNAVLQAVQRQHAIDLQAERDALDVQVRLRTAELTALTSHLQTVREEERAHLARELHDELGALLTAAKLDVARMRRSLGAPSVEVQDRLQHLVAIIDQGIALKRRIIEDLRPSSLTNLGLRAALEILAGEFHQRSGITVRAVLDEVEMPDAACIAIFRLVQESLTNIAKHAGASTIDVRLFHRDGEVRVQVQDNGGGFDPRAVKPGSHGLLGMQFRFEALGGTVRITSAPGHGALIEARLPDAALPPVLQAHAPISDSVAGGGG